jgi:hypothetical protein
MAGEKEDTMMCHVERSVAESSGAKEGQDSILHTSSKGQDRVMGHNKSASLPLGRVTGPIR